MAVLGSHGSSFKKTYERRSKSAQNWLTRDDVVSHPESSAGKRGPPSALRNGRGGALAEQFGSVTRRFPWSVIAVEALSPMVFIHTCRILIMPGHQYLLGFLAPLFESHRRLVSYSGRSPSRLWPIVGQAIMSLRASRTAHTERGRLDRRANELDTTIRKRPSRNNSALSRLRDIGLIDLHCARITSCRAPPYV